MKQITSITAVFPIFCSGKAISHLCMELCHEYVLAGVPARMLVPGVAAEIRDPMIVPAISSLLNPIAGRLNRHWPVMSRAFDRHVRQHLTPESVMWAFPMTSLALRRAAREKGMKVAAECTNCHQAYARRILADAYARLGWPVVTDVTEKGIEEERANLAEADVIIAQGPMTVRSLLEEGVPEERIIASSVGWSPRRLPEMPEDMRRHDDGVRVLFAGYVSVRKGAHLLLKAWRDAEVKGELIVAGNVAADFADHGGEWLQQPNVRQAGYVSEIGRRMAESHIFAFPTLEEGGPMVTYEAAAMGMAIVTTPMGAGAIIRDGIEGVVLDPFDHEAWVETLRRLANDADLRQRLGKAARMRAAEFTWANVAARRLEALRAKLAPVPEEVVTT